MVHQITREQGARASQSRPAMDRDPLALGDRLLDCRDAALQVGDGRRRKIRRRQLNLGKSDFAQQFRSVRVLIKIDQS